VRAGLFEHRPALAERGPPHGLLHALHADAERLGQADDLAGTAGVEAPQSATQARSGLDRAERLQLRIARIGLILGVAPDQIGETAGRAPLIATGGDHPDIRRVPDLEVPPPKRPRERPVLGQRLGRQSADGTIGVRRHRKIRAPGPEVVWPGVMRLGVDTGYDLGLQRGVMILQAARSRKAS